MSVSICLNDKALNLIKQKLEDGGYRSTDIIPTFGISFDVLQNIFATKRISYNTFNRMAKELKIELEIYDILEKAAKTTPQKLKFLRTTSNMTQKDMAQIIYRNEHTFSLIEHHRRELPRGEAELFAEYFGVSTEFLLNGGEER